jgi:hypothetical protein
MFRPGVVPSLMRRRILENPKNMGSWGLVLIWSSLPFFCLRLRPRGRRLRFKVEVGVARSGSRLGSRGRGRLLMNNAVVVIFLQKHDLIHTSVLLLFA